LIAMNTDFYKNFIIVAQTGNITEAAEKLNFAQSALSKQINTLEKFYGVTLLEKRRGKRQVVLTDAGLDFLRRAQEICQVEEGIALDLQSYKKSVGGTLRLSVSQVAVNSFMERYVLPFATLYPEVNFQLHEETAVEQLKSLKDNVIDIAYANAPLPETSSFICKPIHVEKFYAVYKKENILGFNPEDKIELKQLKGVPLSCNYGCLDLLNKLSNNCDFIPEIRFVAKTGYAATKFAEEGSSVAVVSDASCQNLPSDMKRSFINEKELFFEQTLLWYSDVRQSPVVKLFIDFVLKKIERNRANNGTSKFI